MDNPATTAALTARGYALPNGSQAPQTRLDEAWRALQRERSLPGLVARIEAGELAVEDVVDVIAAAALRVLRNPEGLEEDSGSIDDYRETRRHADASIDLYFTAAEIRRLMPETFYVVTAGSFKYS